MPSAFSKKKPTQIQAHKRLWAWARANPPWGCTKESAKHLRLVSPLICPSLAMRQKESFGPSTTQPETSEDEWACSHDPFWYLEFMVARHVFPKFKKGVQLTLATPHQLQRFMRHSLAGRITGLSQNRITPQTGSAPFRCFAFNKRRSQDPSLLP